MTPIPLTADQIRTLDEQRFDEEANENTLRVALQYHSNHRSELQKQRLEFWTDLGAAHGLDMVDKVYETKHIDGQVCVVEQVEKP
jgi:phosphoribosylaminoimidazole-succinocarboxamide synthase